MLIYKKFNKRESYDEKFVRIDFDIIFTENMNKIDFTNKVVIITGASSGIGEESALTFARFRAKLTLVGRSKEKLDKVARMCYASHCIEPLRLSLDLTQAGMCEYVVTKTIEHYGRIDVLINCAGGMKLASVFEQSMEVFDAMMAINLRVPYLLTQLVLPYLLKTKGNVVNVGSSLCSRHREGLLPYVLSKSALQKFTEHAAVETAPEGVRVNCINPGITRTMILDSLSVENQSQPLVYNGTEEGYGRIIEPKEVANLICLTASGVFPNLNGSGINLDCALSLS